MNRRRAVQTMSVAALAAVARPARAASPAAAVYLKRWNTAKEFTLKVADAMPAEHYGFKPTPDQRSFGEVLTHMAAANTRYFGAIQGAPPPMKEPPNADKETVKKFLAETFDWCAGMLGNFTEEDLAKTYAAPGRPTLSGRDLVLNGFIHTAHHRGYSEVYMRLKGVAPPRYEVV